MRACVCLCVRARYLAARETWKHRAFTTRSLVEGPSVGRYLLLIDGSGRQGRLGWPPFTSTPHSLPAPPQILLPSIVRCQGNRVMTGTAYHWVNTPLHETSILGVVLDQSAIFPPTLVFHRPHIPTSHTNNPPPPPPPPPPTQHPPPPPRFCSP